LKSRKGLQKNTMTDFELKNIDPEDIEDLLAKVETSFGIKFASNALVDVKSFGQLCSHIVKKIQLDHSNDCTSQQAFYKLRHAISTVCQIDQKTIATNSPLAILLPKQNRRSRIKKIEAHLGFSLNILRPPHGITGILLVICLASMVGFFFYWKIGLAGFTFSIIALWIANKTGNTLDLQTVGQVAEKMTRENYLKSRRNPKTFHKNEIEKVLADLFSNELNLNKRTLTREATFE